VDNPFVPDIALSMQVNNAESFFGDIVANAGKSIESWNSMSKSDN
jgi:hypothetical protein